MVPFNKWSLLHPCLFRSSSFFFQIHRYRNSSTILLFLFFPAWESALPCTLIFLTIIYDLDEWHCFLGRNSNTKTCQIKSYRIADCIPASSHWDGWALGPLRQFVQRSVAFLQPPLHQMTPINQPFSIQRNAKVNRYISRMLLLVESRSETRVHIRISSSLLIARVSLKILVFFDPHAR